jgi:hypothetical protein
VDERRRERSAGDGDSTAKMNATARQETPWGKRETIARDSEKRANGRSGDECEHVSKAKHIRGGRNPKTVI